MGGNTLGALYLWSLQGADAVVVSDRVDFSVEGFDVRAVQIGRDDMGTALGESEPA